MTVTMNQDDVMRLRSQITEWNNNRLDLFELSLPNEVWHASLDNQCYHYIFYL